MKLLDGGLVIVLIFIAIVVAVTVTKAIIEDEDFGECAANTARNFFYCEKMAD